MSRGFVVFSIALAVFFTTEVKAQFISEFGLKGGINISKISNVDETNYKAGVLAGIFLEVDIPNTSFAFQTELLSVQYGDKDSNSEEVRRLTYFQIPFLIKYGISLPDSDISPVVYFGPYAGFNYKAVVEAKGGNVSGDGNIRSISDDIKDNDSGLLFGAELGIKEFRFGLRYTTGFTEIFEAGMSDGEKNRALAFTIGIALNKKNN